MEFLGQPRPSGSCSLLGVPGLSTLDLDVDEDEGEVVIGIRPKSSPLPRRKSSVSEDDSEPEPPVCGSRRVSFADAKGLSLVHVKEFDTWDVPKLPGYDSPESEGKDAEEYFLSPLTFSLPSSTEELLLKVQEQKVELETIELLPGTTILKGVIRVLNISYSKAVYVRTTLDMWSSHFDLLAEYIPGSSDSQMDCFSFKLTLVPPFGEQGVRVDFCLRYETPAGTFWANNNNRNYVLFCHQRMKERKEKPQKENMNKKSCLKSVGQNISTVENISAMEASSQENISTDVSKYGEKVEPIKTKQISDGQSATSEEDGQKLLTESRRNCSQRNRRKAARMARVRDLFVQRGGGTSDTVRDETLPEAKQPAQEEIPGEKHSDVQSFSEGSSKSEGSLFVSESAILDVVHDLSPAHNSEPEKSESINLADPATLTEDESATNIPDSPLHSNDDPAPGECQNINKSVSNAEENSQKQSTSYECTSNIAAEPADSFISAVSNESLVSKTNSFTFGTVVAPLYHQVFGRVGSESQSISDWGNPVQATLNIGDLTHPHTEGRDTSCTAQTGAVQSNMTKTQESKQEECLDATLNSLSTEEEEGTSLSVTADDIKDHAETLQDIIPSDKRCTNTSENPKTVLGDTDVHSHTVNILNTDLSNPQIPTESLHRQGEAQEDNLTHHMQSQTTAETARVQLPESTCIQMKTNLDETCAQSETEEVLTRLETSFMSLNGNECVDESDKGDDVGKTVPISTSSDISEEDKLLETLHDLNAINISNSATKEAENTSVSCFESLQETNVTIPQISLETHEEINNVEEENKEAMMCNYHTHDDTLKYEEMIVSEKIEHHEMEAVVSKQEVFCLEDSAEVQNWEMMVEEEEKNILTDGEESEEISSKADDTEAVEDQGEQLEDAVIEKVSEYRGTTEMKTVETEDTMVEKITAAREKENKAEDAFDDKQDIREEQTGEIVATKDSEEVEKKLEHVQATKMEKTADGEELAEETEVEKIEEEEETELEKEKHSAEMQEATLERINVQEEEEIEGGIDLNGDETGVEWENEVKPRKENVEEENPDYKEEILVDEMGESKIVDAESESMTTGDMENEMGCFEERSDFVQVEDGLSALVNNVQDKEGIDKENRGEGQNAHIPTENQCYTEEDLQSSENVPHDLSKAARDESDSTAAERDSCIFTDEHESDQLSHDSASAESDSDDEVELYMHCLRAVHAGAQASKNRDKDTGFSVGRRSSTSRSKLLSTPMPSISESLDEEPNLSHLQDNHEDMETADFQPIAAAPPASNGEESIDRNVSWWRETFSCRNISKTLLYLTLLVVFVVVAYHYDFLACFGLYLMSVIWLFCQRERQPVKNSNNNNRIG